jgi:hypothetical protein
MDIEITSEELSRRKIFLATPMYAGQCTGRYARSMMDLTAQALNLNISITPWFLYNESLIPRARNYAVDAFIDTDCTHLMFVDADIAFNAHDVITMLALMSPDSGYDVMGGAYAKKHINWDQVQDAVLGGVPSDKLAEHASELVYNHAQITDVNAPAPVSEIGCGFMMVARQTFYTYANTYPDIMYPADNPHVSTTAHKMGMFFHDGIEPDSGVYKSEDYMFCHKVKKAGMQVWLCPWIRLQHSGYYNYQANLSL